MSDLLTLGASGLKAYSRALSTVGDNIANAQTPGYARRTIKLAEAPPGGNMPLYKTAVLPGGVLVNGVARSVDQWLIDDSRTATSDAGQSSVRLNWLEATERALNNGTAGVGTGLTAIFNKADQLTADPANVALRGQFLSAVDDTAAAFRRSAGMLTSVADGIASDANGTVAQLNTNLSALERVNDGIRRAQDGSTNQATLFDERDRLLDQISESLAVTASYDQRGAVTLSAAGPGGGVLVGGGVAQQLSVSISGGNLSLALVSNGDVIAPTAGKLAGLVDAARHVNDQQSALDALATRVAGEFNAAHMAGITPDGQAGTPLFDATGGAAAMTALPLSANDVAAADAGSSNGAMLAFANLRGTTGVENGWATLVADQAQATASARAQDGAATSRQTGALAARDNVSAVDLDHEAAELMRYQQAYQGAARVIQVAREIMQTILNAT